MPCAAQDRGGRSRAEEPALIQLRATLPVFAMRVSEEQCFAFRLNQIQLVGDMPTSSSDTKSCRAAA